jgi:hypothetical protein
MLGVVDIERQHLEAVPVGSAKGYMATGKIILFAQSKEV